MARRSGRRRYSQSASEVVERVMHRVVRRRKRGTLRVGKRQ